MTLAYTQLRTIHIEPVLRASVVLALALIVRLAA